MIKQSEISKRDKRIKELAEQLNIARETLRLMRDSTYKSAVTMRGMAEHALQQMEEKNRKAAHVANRNNAG